VAQKVLYGGIFIRTHHQTLYTGVISVYWGYISIDGDLRDYDNINEILEWIKSMTIALNIRQGMLQIETEGLDTRILSYDCNNGWKL
jgi:hypothetical protein